MPILIKELIIRATVSEESNGSNATGQALSPGSSRKTIDQEKVVRRCVDEVLEVLRIKNER